MFIENKLFFLNTSDSVVFVSYTAFGKKFTEDLQKIKTAAVYARYSSDNQTEQSIEGQLRVCEEYAQGTVSSS